MSLKHRIRDIIKKMIMRNIINESKIYRSVDDNLSLVYSFFSTEYSIRPFQIRNEIKTLLKILEVDKPKTLVEIGTANGGTLFLFSKIATNNALLISIDLPSGQFGGEFYPEWKVQLYQSFANYNQKIVTIRNDSHISSTLESIVQLLEGHGIDFLFIDGDHTYEGVKKDYELYSPLLNKDGIIGFHDINPGPKELVGGVPEFWKQIRKVHKYVEIIDKNNLTGGYGIGLLFLDSNNENMKYENAIKSLEYLNKDDNIEKSSKSLLFKIKNLPLLLMLKIYFNSKKYFTNKDT